MNKLFNESILRKKIVKRFTDCEKRYKKGCAYLKEAVKKEGGIIMDKKQVPRSILSIAISTIMVLGNYLPYLGSIDVLAATDGMIAEKTENGYHLKNDYFDVETGKYGEITSLKIVGDEFDTNYVMNVKDNPKQDTDAHEWLGDLMFKTKKDGEDSWRESLTNSSDAGRSVELKDNKIVVTYDNSKTEGTRAIKDFKLVETYSLVDDQLKWDITVENTNDSDLVFGDFGVPLAFHEIWVNQGEAYEACTVDHSFVGKDSSYVYATRPSGQGHFLLMTPETETGAGFEYQDHWQVGQRRAEEKEWCMDQADWANGLNVFYIHSDAISKDAKSGNKGYMESSSMTLKAGESKTYSFNFTGVADESEMKTELYDEGVIDAVAVPGMTFAKDMPAKMYLHTKVDAKDISFEYRCPHTNNLHQGTNTVSNNLACERTDENTYAKYLETKEINGEQYHIYEIAFGDLGQNDIIVNYKQDGEEKTTMLQFYMMDDLKSALSTHSDFLLKTQWDAAGEIQDKVFDDWMMDTKSKRGSFDGYWGWGDDWGYVHGEYLAEMNSYNPVKEQVQALDEYLNVAIWQNLMGEHQEDYLIHDFLMEEPNNTPTYRGFAYPHIYNTYFAMYKIAKQYPDLIDYIEDADTYLLRCYNIMDALYNEGTVGYNWATGLMGESTTPDIIEALQERGYEEEAANLTSIMEKKFQNFANDPYPYISEYPYDNTSEEAIYTLAKMFGNDSVMSKVNEKTRACRGVQPIWYHYGNPTTICGENWFNFQYTASLAGYCMDDWLRFENNGLSSDEMGEAQRINYAGKLANFTVINSGQIDADPENIGTVSWTYQSEMGNDTALGTGGGKLHNGWRQMSGEADLALFGAVRIASSDVAIDPVFGLFGYGCEVTDNGASYSVVPLDGVYHRLNLINNKISLELYRDQYDSATVSKDGSTISMNIVNVTGVEHESNLDLTGIPAGNYQVLVNGELSGSFIAGEGTTTVALPLPAGDSAKVEIKAGDLLENTTPVVDAGKDVTTAVNETVMLHGSARDNAWLHTEPAVKWSVEEAPEEAEVNFSNKETTSTKVSFTKAGEYTLKLTAKGKSNSASDTVKVTVEGASDLPEVLAQYDFEDANMDTANKKVKDISGSGIDAQQKGNVEVAEGKDGGNGISMDGEIGGYVKLSSDLTRSTKEATISMDVKLNGTQTNGTRLFEFGDMDGNVFQVSFESANELSMTVTNLETNESETVKAGVLLNSGSWQNVEVTLKDNTAVLYINGEAYAQIKDAGFSFDKLGKTQKNFIGRSSSESSPWLNGTYDNFKMLSKAASAEELKKEYGSEAETTIKNVVISPVITSVGVAPNLPKTAKVEYSNGLCKYESITWGDIEKSLYAKRGEFEATGKLEAIDYPVSTKVQVVEGKEQNIALIATPTAIVNTPEDLGGVAGLNDGYDPASSRDTSHGVWHNWQGGNQSGDAWVQYTWNNEVTITGTDAYYFTDGNFAPASVSYQYLDADGNWKEVENGEGFGVKLNQYNKTIFAPVTTTAIRMWMKPKTLGCGVIEWKVYGYSNEMAADKQLLKAALDKAKSVDTSLFEEGADATLSAAIEEAQAVYDNKEATQDEVDAAAAKLERVIASLPAKDGNLAFSATASTSFVSGWEKLSGINDGLIPENSYNPGIARYGTWGNTSKSETLTYTWGSEVTLKGSDIYFWYDGSETDNGGINLPTSYVYEYLDEDGNWKEVPNASAYNLDIDKFNETTFDEVTTTAIRVTLNKQAEDNTGVGVVEWKVYGTLAPVDKSELTEAIKEAETLEAGSYTEESWTAFTKALANAKAIEADAQASKKEAETALSALIKAQNNLEEVTEAPDKTALTEMIQEAETKQQEAYTEESWNTFKTALDTAKEVAESETATKEQIEEALSNLKEAMANLELSKPDTEVKNLAPDAKTDGLCNYDGLDGRIDDLGGLASLNNEKEPANSADTSNGVWHNWHNRYAEDGSVVDGWVSYTWEKAVEIESMDVYYFQDGGGNFLPQSASVEYLDENGNWVKVADAQNLECAADKYNTIALGKLKTTAVRLTVAPQLREGATEDASRGTGIIEWKVNGVYAVEEPETVNKEALSAALVLAEQKEESAYTEESWNAFKEAFDAAKEVYAKEDATQAEVDAAVAALETAMEALKEKADKTELNALIERAKEKNEADYTTESFETFKTALETAEKAAENENATQAEVDAVKTALAEAMQNLVEKQEVNKGALQAAIEEADKKVKEDYTEESFESFERVLKSAKEVYADENAAQEEVDNQTALLNAAMANLVAKPTEPENPADKSKLESSLEKAEALTRADYTEETWKIFAEALEKAQSVAGNETATQEEVDEAVSGLESAMTQLEKVDGGEEKPSVEELKALVEKAEELNKDDYVASTWDNFAQALEAAKAVLDLDDATQAEIEAAEENLQKAMEALLSKTGWQVINGQKYYYGEDGTKKTGWQEIDGKKYYFGEENDGAMKTYWQQIDGKWYFFGNDGVMRTYWQKIWGKWYFLGNASDGAMKTGWQQVYGKWYYLGFAEDGSMKTYWQQINGKWYFFGGADDGAMKTGWQKIWGKWYYLGSANDGAMKTGWQKINGKWYYFGGEQDGSMKSNVWVGDYYLDNSGVWSKTKKSK